MPDIKPSKSEIEALIVDFIVNGLGAVPASELETDANLFAEGYLDSISIMRLIAHLEAALAIKIPPKDLVPRHFITVQAMVDYLGAR